MIEEVLAFSKATRKIGFKKLNTSKLKARMTETKKEIEQDMRYEMKEACKVVKTITVSVPEEKTEPRQADSSTAIEEKIKEEFREDNSVLNIFRIKNQRSYESSVLRMNSGASNYSMFYHDPILDRPLPFDENFRDTVNTPRSNPNEIEWVSGPWMYNGTS